MVTDIERVLSHIDKEELADIAVSLAAGSHIFCQVSSAIRGCGVKIKYSAILY